MPSSTQTLTLKTTVETTRDHNIGVGDLLTATNGATLEVANITNEPDYPIQAKITSIPEGAPSLPGSSVGSVAVYNTNGERYGNRPEWHIVAVNPPKPLDVSDLPVGSELRCLNGELLTVDINDGTDQPIKASNHNRTHDDGGRTAWWYRRNGIRNIDCNDQSNPWDIVEVIRRGPAPVVSLENVEVGDKVRCRDGVVREVQQILAEDHGGGCIKAGGYWYFRTGKINPRVRGGYEEYDVLEVIKAPKPRFNFTTDGNFVPGALYENGEGARFIFNRYDRKPTFYNYVLRRLAEDGTISTQEEAFCVDGRYYAFDDDERRDIVRFLGTAQVKLAS